MKLHGILVGCMLLAASTVQACGTYRRSSIRGCFANQKTVAGAVEMYNLDFDTSVEVLTPEIWAALKQKGYLQALPRDPGAREVESHTNYVLVSSSSNGVACLRHGCIQSNVGGDGDTRDLSALPRELLRQGGITDPALLARALETRAPAWDSWTPHRGRASTSFGCALRTTVFGLLPFASQHLAWMLLLTH